MNVSVDLKLTYDYHKFCFHFYGHRSVLFSPVFFFLQVFVDFA